MSILGLGLAAMAIVVAAAAQQPANEERMAEEALTPEQFRAAHASLTSSRDPSDQVAAVTDKVARRIPADGTEAVVRRSFVDEHIFGEIERVGISHAPSAEDGEFLRRVYLDLIGRIPTPGEIRSFLADADPDKRAATIDRLLEREEFSEKWAYFYMDLFRRTEKWAGAGNFFTIGSRRT